MEKLKMEGIKKMYSEIGLLKDFMTYLFGRSHLNSEHDYHDAMSIVEDYLNE
jgi:hypothetical protein